MLLKKTEIYIIFVIFWCHWKR